MPKTLYLIDGHAQIFRAYYAPFGKLSAPSGEPTRATHVFCQMLLNLIRDRRPDYLATVLDVSDQTVFRKDIYPDYKAHRDPPPEDFAPQHDRIISILEGMGMPILRREGFEADDIMATLAERYGGGRRATQASKSPGQGGGWILGGPLVVSFDKGDVRLSPAGLIVDGDEESREITFTDAGDGRDERLRTFYEAVALGRALPADGRWGKATQEVLVAVERSAQTRTEVMLSHQTPYPDVGRLVTS